MDIWEKRASIRQGILKKRQQLSQTERTILNKKITTHLDEWIHSSEHSEKSCSFNAIMVYLSMKSEVDTQEVVELLLLEGKQVIVPTVDTDTGQLIPREIQDLNRDLIKHPYGMFEPNNDCPVFPIEQLQLILVPGIAFDLKGFRLGYGKGFYDRFLPKCPTAISIGLAFQSQLVKDTFPQQWDVPVQHIITEEGML